MCGEGGVCVLLNGRMDEVGVCLWGEEEERGGCGVVAWRGCRWGHRLSVIVSLDLVASAWRPHLRARWLFAGALVVTVAVVVAAVAAFDKTAPRSDVGFHRGCGFSCGRRGVVCAFSLALACVFSSASGVLRFGCVFVAGRRLMRRGIWDTVDV